MQLPKSDIGGRPLTYHARLEREGRHLHASELVGEALQEQDMFLAGTYLMFLTIMLIIGNFVADIALAWADPRIRFD